MTCQRCAQIVTLVLLATIVALPSQPGHSAALDKDSCNRLKTEQDGLEKQGVRANILKGPEWAKANLPADKLEQVRRVIELDEQLLFRCAGKPLVVLPPEPDPAAPPPEEKEKGDGKKAPAGKAAAKEPKAKTKDKKGAALTKTPPAAAAEPSKGEDKAEPKAEPKAEAAKEPQKEAATPTKDATPAEAEPQPPKKAKSKRKQPADNSYTPADFFNMLTTPAQK